MPFSFEQFNPFAPVELSSDDLIQIDNLIIHSLKNMQLGKPLEILLLTEEELKNYDEKLAEERMKKLNARLHQFVNGLQFTTEGNQVKIGVPEFIDEEKLRARFISKPGEALLPMENIQNILARLSAAIIAYSVGDLFIDALSDEEAANANKRFELTPLERENFNLNDERFSRFMNYLDKLSQANNISICNWMKHYKIPQFSYNHHEGDKRFTQVFVLPIRYQIQCPGDHVSQLFEALKADAKSYLIPEQIFLSEMLWKLKSHDYVVHGGGKIINGKQYSTSAANLVKKLETLLATKIDLHESSAIEDFKRQAQALAQDIREELKHKRTSQTGRSFGWWGQRDKTTINLYEEILNITEQVMPSILEEIPLRTILSKLQNHHYVINGFGKTVFGKKYTTSAGNVVEKIENLFAKRINYNDATAVESLKAEIHELFQDIAKELSGKTKATAGSCFNLGGRDLSTAQLYSEIVEICSSNSGTVEALHLTQSV
ncbi:hypothetical protein [Legionella cardiaca]|uniref:Uncharacterized protein n=1 Tax=Legionella cardiaca TaxID=1071983 RepID=A0ABY8AU67_9GAMM|nr:hypothetical protein [Legionella cardiaca]WED42687.1 hypothetical protein PXX05_12385 [Legionella cardiaca]